MTPPDAGAAQLDARALPAEAEAAERAAFAAIGALGAVELDAVKVWVASGCEGPQPRPAQEARRVLTDRLTAAIDAREAAEKVAGGRGEVCAPLQIR